ncbi:MAG: hypothetical protein OIN87_12705 [Candidatus Methanoperedens sp.]|nr:hypothetical protein [Candidatus Methanoperedens sp.]
MSKGISNFKLDKLTTILIMKAPFYWGILSNTWKIIYGTGCIK